MHHCDVISARANLCSAGALLLAVALSGCSRSAERLFELTSAAPSFVGLIDTPACVVSVTDLGVVRCLSSAGDALWRAEVCKPVRQRPALVGGSLVIACDSGEWVALDVKTGKARWKLAGRRVPVAALRSDGLRGFVAGEANALEAIDETGLSLWTVTAGPRVFAAGDVVVASSPDQGVLALEAKTGARLWADDTPAIALGGNEQVIVVAHAAGDLVAYGAVDGKQRWAVTLGALASDTLSVEAGSVLIGLARPELVELSVETGTEKSRTALPQPLSAPVSSGVAALLGNEGCAALLGTQPLQTVCVQHQLRGPAVVRDGVLLLGPRDGRVLGYKLKSAAAP